MTTTLESLAAKWEAEAQSSANNALDCYDEEHREILEAEAETLTACAAELRAALALGEPDEAAVERAAEAACTERCAQRGEPPCWRLDINGQIDIECNCIDIARAALRSRAADES